MAYTYNAAETIRTEYSVEKIYSTNKGFIGRLANVDYKQSDGSWKSQGSRWLINESDPVVIMDNGFSAAKL
ncbi:hypothetical protein H8F06_21535 [Vibrio fluvialis]|uniref:hypothetical protein n=1 Tax=Vibrio fluvialis TaxID=676 RepID=UPI00192C907E|nr:hypothetical protein [Vibrio fluvialis]MBL4297865.1 hypothetical protein [Vibrio fluvialis]